MLIFQKHIILNRWLLSIVLAFHSFFICAQLADSGQSGLNIEIFSFVVSSDIVYRAVDQFKTTEGKQSFVEGWTLNSGLDSMQKEISELRLNYNSATELDERDIIANKLLQLEYESIGLKNKVDLMFNKSREAELEFWNNVPVSEKNELLNENRSTGNLMVEAFDQEDIVSDIELINDENVIEIEENVPEPELPSPVVSHNLVVYKVQIGAYSRGLPDYIDRLYKKLSVLRRIDTYTNDRGVTVYTVGELSNFDDAVRLQNQIRQEGVQDAFVVAFLDGKRITIKEAREISEK
jgi:hypothetical protein